MFAAAGIQAVLLPTALLSTHTGGFGTPYRRDLTEDMAATLTHWQGLPVRFDAIHVGYLTGERQLGIVRRAIGAYRAPGTWLFLDPVMGDGGRRYSGCSPALAAGFRALCRGADLIFPNRTEAALLLDEPYQEAAADRPEALRRQLGGLLSLGAGAAVITGIGSPDGRIGAAALARGMASPLLSLSPRAPGSWPGTGDLFASAAEAALMRGRDIGQALEIAAGFLRECLRAADGDPAVSRFGVPFEGALPWLNRAILG